MKRFVAFGLVMFLGAALTVCLADTWTGAISDKMCGAEHHGGADPVKCTLGCVKGGSPYVFVVSKDKILDIENQKDAKIASQLEKYAGKKVSLTGSMSKDGKAVTVEKIEAGK